MEDDEMLQQVTQNATKKVYILYTQALPLLIISCFSRLIVIFSLSAYYHFGPAPRTLLS